MTEAEAAQIVRLYTEDRLVGPQIAAQTGIPLPSVYRILKRAGVTSRGPRQKRRKPLAERFWALVDKNGPIIRPELGPCWIWKGSIAPNGYGKFGMESYEAPEQAHRVAYSLETGAPLEEVIVCHKCDHRPCVRPTHLFPGTKKDNTQDAIDKGRFDGAFEALRAGRLLRHKAS